MKKLKFASNLVPLVLFGEKTSTWRMFDDKDLRIKDKLDFLDSEDGKNFAKAEIIEIKEKKLREILEQDFEGHEKFKNEEEMFETYKKYYGDKVTLNTVVKIIKFKLL